MFKVHNQRFFNNFPQELTRHSVYIPKCHCFYKQESWRLLLTVKGTEEKKLEPEILAVILYSKQDKKNKDLQIF